MKLNRFKIRVTLLALTLSILGFLGVASFFRDHLWVTRITLVLLWILLLYTLIRLVTLTNRKLTVFLESLKFMDNIAGSASNDPSFRELGIQFNHIIETVKKANRDREAQGHYFKNTVEHVSIGLLSYNGEGKITLVNKAARELLGTSRLLTLPDLKRVKEGMEENIRQMQPGSTLMLSFVTGKELKRISVKKTSLRILDEAITIISLQDIRPELEEEELETWQKLISILRHEIMNSVAPVRSLTGSLQRITTRIRDEIDPASAQALEEGLSAIASRTEGMMSFVQAYRTLTSIPKPRFREFGLDGLIREATLLFRENREGFEITTEALGKEDLRITADPNLISQVLINLLQNAVNAIDKKPGKIEIKYGADKDGRVFIRVKDKGCGMDPDELEKIFIPFYTTREEGTGIGLSLSRQIMRLHKGSIGVHSEKGKGSEFILRF